MRRLPLLTFLLVAGCSPGGDAAPGATDTLTEADRLLARVDHRATAEAFERAARLGYTADLRVVESDDAGQDVGAETLSLRATPREVSVQDRSGTGTLAEAEPDGTPRLRDPLASALSEDPPFLDPASRDQYRRTVVGDTTVAGRRLRVVQAVLADADAEHAVRRVRAAVDPATGTPVVVEVDRGTESAVYDEVSRVRVELAPGPGGAWLPRHVATDARVDVPLAAPRRVRTEWRVREVGAET